jgi:tetratricopeptide (TPR) repeat protein
MAYQKALAQMRENNWHGALQTLELPAQLTPAYSPHLLLRAHCFWALGWRMQTLAAAAEAQRLSAEDPAMLDAIAAVFSRANDQESALAAADRAVTLAPGHPSYRYNRATIRRFLGDMEGAEADYDVVIAARPTDYEAYLNRSELRQQTVERNHIPELESMLARAAADPRGTVQIQYALAKEYEDLGEYERSFQHLRSGADLRRAHMKYDVSVDVATVDWIIDSFPGIQSRTGVIPAAGGSPSSPPVFIVGLPRAGSTLVERILSSHSDIAGAAELDCFARALVDAASRVTGKTRMPRQDLVKASALVDFAALGEDYTRRARAALGLEGRFIDKMPLNYLYCGLIHKALPDAKIIHVTRHPMAAGYAMYKTLFKDAYPFSYDLDDIARYYLAYRRLMDHWREVLGEALLEVRYEDVIRDQLGQTRRLLRHCELPWQDQCLEFHRNPAATTTASASQVRRPLYRTSLEKWRHFASPLEPLRRALVAGGIEIPDADDTPPSDIPRLK